MTGDKKRSLVSRIADDVWNRGDLAAADEVMSERLQYHGPHMAGGTVDREGWKRAVGTCLGAFPDSRVIYDDLIVAGDMVVGRWSATATHTGPLPGLEPTGRRIELGGITIYRMDGGAIVEAWEHLDMLGMWRQLGVFTPPGHG